MKSLIIYDWDDTLFPTSWYLNNLNMKLQLIDNSIYKLLYKSLQISNIIIVTNAHLNWIYKIINYMPMTQQLIKQNIPIISTINNYSHIGLNNIDKLKTIVYNNDIIEFINNCNNIISIGDSECEYKALVSLGNKFYNKKKLKNIKLISKPTLNELLDEHQILLKEINNINNYNNHCDLIFNKH